MRKRRNAFVAQGACREAGVSRTEAAVTLEDVVQGIILYFVLPLWVLTGAADGRFATRPSILSAPRGRPKSGASTW